MDSSFSDSAKEKAKRGYRACLHCRSRKAKCDLGDIDAPSSPPCSRCKRESRECVFAPSRRGGNNAARRRFKTEENDIESDILLPPQHPVMNPTAAGGTTTTLYSLPTQPTTDGFHPSPSQEYLGHAFSHPSSSSNDLSPLNTGPSPHAAQSGPSSHLHPNVASGPATGGSSSSGPSAGKSPDSKRRRLHLHPSLHAADPSSIVVADMQNESDALNILALASSTGRAVSEGSKSPRPSTRTSVTPGNGAPGRARQKYPARLEDYALVRLGIVDVSQVTRLAESFFRYHHHLFPMIPSSIIPNSPEQLAQFARNEQYFLTAMIIIASRHDPSPGMRDVHDRSWAVMRGWLADIQYLGAPATIGVVESCLLLAENLPRDPARAIAGHELDPTHAQGFGEEVHGAENRQAWMLIGTAIRCAYGLGIDKLALKLFPESERTIELERARLVWTYCYLFDRHISLRLGKAFWARGPTICFQGFSSSAQTGPAAAAGNFPYLREIKAGGPGGEHPQEDLSGLVQAYLELTQLMSNAHDVLYPNAARTRSLVVYGEYFKYLDELARSLDGFKILWREKKWNLFPLTDAVWAMFYYTQLYICAFSFQAHVERAAMRAEEEYQALPTDAARPPLSLFPRGAAASPDARYIFETMEAARQLLHICVDSLHPGGALPFLPSRFLLWFTYAAIVLLKALYSGAMLRADHAGTHKLIDRLCAAFEQASGDDDHPAVRYGRQLQALRRKLAGMSTTVSSPTGGNTVPLPSVSATPVEPHPVPQPSSWMPQPPQNESPQWSFPAPINTAQTISFPYSTTPGPSAYVAPPHQQPLSEVGNLHPREFTSVTNSSENLASINNNLGFATLEDWFGNGLGMPGSNGNGNTGGISGVGGPGSGGGGNDNPFEGIDLADFWMKVGPGEAQGGFPFR